MALVKKSTLGSRAKTSQPETVVEPAPARPAAASKIAKGRATTAVQKIEQATHELASGLMEASAASTELQRAVDMISSGAEEAAGAAQESLGLISTLTDSFRDAREQADDARRQAEAVQNAFAEVAIQIDGTVAAIELNAQRQMTTVALVASLEAAANTIGVIGSEVADVSDQTSLLALNATIEAARAGEVGAGFAVVADEVRTLAESSEASAGDMQKLVASIIDEIKVVATRIRNASDVATAQAQSGRDIMGQLQVARSALATLGAGSKDILATAIEAEAAAREAQRGSEQVASAAEEQSAAVAEAQQAIGQQSSSLEESQQTAESLGLLTQALRGGEGGQVAVEQVAAAAEQLSATVQELSGASGQILVALEQIARGTEIQAAATMQSNTAMGQIERSAELAQQRASAANERIAAIVTNTDEGHVVLQRLANGVDLSINDVKSVLELLVALHGTARKIEKITDSLALVAVQTNMLAVSGAVEATRAGEAGRGFATVAADIRNLSRNAASSADTARDTIRQIQDEIVSVRQDLDQVVAANESELTRNLTLVERFGTIVSDLEAAQASNAAILAGTDMMLRSVREVRSGTAQIAESADLGAAATREAGAAARQQAQGSEALAAAIEEIASIAAALAGKGA